MIPASASFEQDRVVHDAAHPTRRLTTYLHGSVQGTVADRSSEVSSCVNTAA